MECMANKLTCWGGGGGLTKGLFYILLPPACAPRLAYKYDTENHSLTPPDFPLRAPLSDPARGPAFTTSLEISCPLHMSQQKKKKSSSHGGMSVDTTRAMQLLETQGVGLDLRLGPNPRQKKKKKKKQNKIKNNNKKNKKRGRSARFISDDAIGWGLHSPKTGSAGLEIGRRTGGYSEESSDQKEQAWRPLEVPIEAPASTEKIPCWN